MNPPSPQKLRLETVLESPHEASEPKACLGWENSLGPISAKAEIKIGMFRADQFCHPGSTSNKNPVTLGKVQPGYSSEQQISWIDSQMGVLLRRARNEEDI